MIEILCDSCWHKMDSKSDADFYVMNNTNDTHYMSIHICDKCKVTKEQIHISIVNPCFVEVKDESTKS